MEFTVSKADLVRELNLSQGVVEKKTTIPILSNVLVEAVGDRINLTATDLELGIRSSCPARVKKHGAGTIPAEAVARLCSAAAGCRSRSEAAGEPVGQPGVRALAHSHRGNVAGEFSGAAADAGRCWRRFPWRILASMIAKTIFAISMEESRFTLNGSLLLLKSNGLTMVATDGHRLAMVESPIELPGVTGTFRALLPRKAMGEILKLAQDASRRATLLEFSGDENHLFFQLGERLLLSRKLTGNFPGFRARACPRIIPTRCVLDREELRKSVERVSQFSDERSRAIRLRVEDGELQIHSSLSETGESEETLPAEYDGQSGGDRVQRDVPAGFPAGDQRGESHVPFQGSLIAPANCGRPATALRNTATS